MAEEQKIDGLPEGCNLVKLEERVPPLNSYKHFIMYAIVERIPKPKRNVLIAEVAITDEEARVIRISTVKILSSPIAARVVDSWRIEERDA